MNVNSESIDDSDLKYIKVIGRGGFGLIYHGEFCGKEVAIKTFPNGQNNKQELFEMINSEIQVMSSLHHPNLILYMGCSNKSDGCSIVMEL